MKIPLPRSLSGRLLLGAAVFTFVALILATILIGLILQRFIVSQLDQRLDSVIASLSEAIEAGPDGALRLSRLRDGPPFDRLGSGWYWQAEGGGMTWRSASLGSGSIAAPPVPLDWRRLLRGHPAPVDGPDAMGHFLHFRQGLIMLDGKPVQIIATAPRAAINGLLRDAILPLVASLVAIGLVLGGATLLQVRLGLRPLRAMMQSVKDVREGVSDRLPDGQPVELQPLARELNALIDQNVEQLASARLHVANLAHGLKTPLASLGLAVREPGVDPDGKLALLITQMEARIRHHLGRARAGSAGRAALPQIAIAPHLADLVSALGRIHADRSIDLRMHLDPDLAVACEPQDLDEMLGNLLDNAFKWARFSIAVTATADAGQVVISIQDDGPGLPEDRLSDALTPGRRLDEAVPGDGFGLSIVRELAGLHNGTLDFQSLAGGGLKVTLILRGSVRPSQQGPIRPQSA